MHEDVQICIDDDIQIICTVKYSKTEQLNFGVNITSVQFATENINYNIIVVFYNIISFRICGCQQH